ncbi:MAG: hypothetical protein HQM00_00980 [Magnetococcales bacterium]|nr:hypothetical protein [Magnetococcales bacterium]
MGNSWRSLENAVRKIASTKWGVNANAEHLGGIDFDAVLRPSADHLILIEVTENDRLSNVRDNISKINSFRHSMLAEGVYCKAYILLEDVPTNSMIETARQNKITICSLSDFADEFFNFSSYVMYRTQQPFGSALNPFTGMPDSLKYVSVSYTSPKLSFDALKISEELVNGEHVLLVGDYGTGKSRCVKEVFDILTVKNKQIGRSVFAINLRDHWGAKTASEIIAGHLEEIGLSEQVDNAMRIINSGGVILLLDGIDEVGAQVFGSSWENRRTLRRSALEGVRKLINKNKGGILVTSRSHYFDSDEEMIASIGLKDDKVKVVVCPEEFSDSQAKEYLAQINVNAPVPDWLPRKPLVFQVISTIETDLANNILLSHDGEFSFWGKFITTICEREAKIHGSLQANAVQQILIILAEITRNGGAYLGKLSVKDIREAYERAIGETPDQAGELMLMRLCSLGRIGPESPERQFVDEYIVDGLRAESLVNIIDKQEKSIINKQWKQPLMKLGWNLLLDSLQNSYLVKKVLFESYLKKLAGGSNIQAYCEIFSVLASVKGDTLKPHITLDGCDIYCLVVGERQLSDVNIKRSYIRNFNLLPEVESKKSRIKVDDCQIIEIYGISSDEGLPDWISNTEVEKYDSLSNAKKIRNSELSSAHRLFLSVIHKIFFQPGAGREERSLFKGGFGGEYSNKTLSKILSTLHSEGLIEKIPGDDGNIYKPVRRYSRRMALIKSQLALSADPLWEKVSEF